MKKISGIKIKTSENIDDIENLWNKLHNYHMEISERYRSHHSKFTFNDRKQYILKSPKLLILTAEDSESNKKIGFCVSTINDNRGEVESLYIDTNYRKMNIGKTFIEMSENWFKKSSVKKYIIGCVYENEKGIEFYKRIGLSPKSVIFQKFLDD